MSAPSSGRGFWASWSAVLLGDQRPLAVLGVEAGDLAPDAGEERPDPADG